MTLKHVECMFSHHGAKICHITNFSTNIFLPSNLLVSGSNIFSSSLTVLYCHHFLSLSPFCIVFSTYKYFLLQILSLPLSLSPFWIVITLVIIFLIFFIISTLLTLVFLYILLTFEVLNSMCLRTTLRVDACLCTNCFSIFAEKVSQDVNLIVTYKTNEVKFSFTSLGNTFFYFLSFFHFHSFVHIVLTKNAVKFFLWI